MNTGSSPLVQDRLRGLLAHPGLAAVLAALEAPDEETRLVGGCVRDALLGRPLTDIDLATTRLPRETLAAAEAAGLKAIPTGLDHGTVTVLAAGAPFEVTTLREDVETDGRHAVVRFGQDFATDAARRDFTINALMLDAGGRLHDVTGGEADLAAGRVRFIGQAATRIREDALRILRFFRFHARYGCGAPDAEGLEACIHARDALDGLSRERVRAEFLKLLVAPGAAPVLATLSETGLLARIVAGIGDFGRFVRAAAAGGSETERLAALCVQSGADADRLRERLRLSNFEHAALVAYAKTLASVRGCTEIRPDMMRAFVAEHGEAPLRQALAAMAGEPRPRVTPEARAVLATARVQAPPRLPLSGGDLVAAGLTPGPEVGRSLAAARALWLAEGCPADGAAKERLMAHALAYAHEKPAGPGDAAGG